MTGACDVCGTQVDRRSRGLCTLCYSRAQRTGTVANYERKRRDPDELLDEWVRLRDDGITARVAAPRLGVNFEALDRALARAKRRGDPRGIRTPFGRETA